MFFDLSFLFMHCSLVAVCFFVSTLAKRSARNTSLGMSFVLKGFPCEILKLKHEASILHKKKRLINRNQTILQHLLQNKLIVDYFTASRLNDIFKVCGFAYMIKLGDQSIVI